MFIKSFRLLATGFMVAVTLVVVTEHRGQSAASPSPVIDYQAADYTAGSTTWVNRATAGTANAGQGDGTLPSGGVSKTASGDIALQFTGKAVSNSDRVAGTIGSTSAVSSVSIEMWIKLKDDGSTQNASGSMLFSWLGSPHYNVYHYKHGIGFNTINAEIYGINATSFVNQWKHIVFVMVKGGTAAQQKIYVNGVQQTTSCNPVGNLSSLCDTSTVNSLRQFNVNGDFLLMDNGYSSNTWNAIADVGMVRIYKTELTASEVTAEFNETIANGYPDVAPPAVSSVVVPSSPSTSRNISYSYTFSESISGLSASDFSNTGTATGCTFSPASSSGVTIRVDVSCTSDGTVIAKLAQNSVTDAATNTGPASVHTADTVTIAVPAATTPPAATTTPPVATTTPPAATTTVAPAATTTTTSAPISDVVSTTPLPANNAALGGSISPNNSVASQLNPTDQKKKQVSTTTTVVRNTAVASTIPSTSTTIPLVVTTTSAPLSTIDVPVVDEGTAVLQVGGKPVPVEITRSNNEVKVSSGVFTAELQVIRNDGTVSSLSSAGDLEVSEGDSVKANFSGLKPGSILEVRMYSDPVLLGRTEVTENGTVAAQYEIPSEAASGQHSFTVLGVDNQGVKLSFFTPLQVKGDGQGSRLVTLVIGLPLVAAIAMAIFLPPFIRRRKIS